jgi:hypothetical protein
VSARNTPLLPDGIEVPFAEIESTMARLAAGDNAPVHLARSLASSATSTVVAIGPRERLGDAAAALKEHAESGAIRAILMVNGDPCPPAVRVTAREILLEGLRPPYVDNAVAALRLPSLPAVLWWRGGDPAQVNELARLADRLVLDAEDPQPLWTQVEALARETPVSDLRWTGLTRWRALMAHFFDMPGVPEAAASFTRIGIVGSDRYSAQLFASWLRASLNLESVSVDVTASEGSAIQSVTFGNGTAELSLRRLGGECVEARARLDGGEVSRIASIGDQNLAALVAEELRVRSHDAAFEAAVRLAGAAA